MHQSSHDKMLDFKNRYLKGMVTKPLKILDLGSQDVNGTYKDIFDVPSWRYQGMDMAQGKNVDIVLENPYAWKEIAANSIDVLITGQALEHIEFFWITMLEIARILKPGGLCCIIAPSAGVEHKYPVDCWRFYTDGFKALSRFALLKEVEVYKQQEPESRYAESSNIWLDSVLICKKGKYPGLLSFRHRIWRYLAHKILVKGI